MHTRGHRDAGKYKLLAELGRGGMANVYLAVARGPSGFNKLVVLKSLRSDLAGDPELLSMFWEEARLAARLNHPHVVQTYEVGEYAGRPVIVMEYLEGQTLANVLQRAKGQMSLALHLRVIIDSLEGLHHAHELTDFAGKALGLVHRDMSPQNVFITFDGQVKVLDFGIAKVVNSQAQTSTGVLKGKVKYMAREQRGAHLRKVSNRGDSSRVQVPPPTLGTLGARVPGDGPLLPGSAWISVKKSPRPTAPRFEAENRKKFGATAAAFGIAAALG